VCIPLEGEAVTFAQIGMTCRAFGMGLRELREDAVLSPTEVERGTQGRIPSDTLARAEQGRPSAILQIMADTDAVIQLLSLYGLRPDQPDYRNVAELAGHAAVLRKRPLGPFVDALAADLDALGDAGGDITLHDLLVIVAAAYRSFARNYPPPRETG
jgi:hypothetical protein